LRDEVFRYVGPNQGDYRRDSLTGRYVRDARGDYKRVVVPTGRLARAREWSWNGSGEMTSFEPAVLSGSFSQNRTSTDAAVLSELSRQDLRLVLKSLEPIATPTLGAGSDFSQDRTLVATGQARSRQHAYLELYSDRIPEVEVRFRIEPSRSRRRLSTGEADYDERSWQVQAGPVIGRRLRLELELGYEYKSIAEPLSYPELGRFSLTTQQVGLARAFSFAGRTRVRGSAGLTRRTATVRTLPFDLSLDQPLGMTPTAGLNLEHSFSQVLSASARYGYLDRPDRAAEHQLNAELKASF